MKYFNKLISISSESINSIKSVDLPVELKKLYREKNGFVAFESTFRIYDIDTLVNINSLIQSELSIGGIFFGDNALGEGFCIKGNDFYRYDFELDELEFIGTGIEEFSYALLSKYNYYTGYKLAKDWMKYNNALDIHNILMPIIPFSLGGEYSNENLVAYPRCEGIKIKIKFCKTISGYSDGMQVKLDEVYNLNSSDSTSVHTSAI